MAIVLICAAVGAYLALRQPQRYVATAVIQVEQQEQHVLRTEETVRLEAADYLTTIVASLTGDSFLVRVAKAANLVNDPEFFEPRPEPYSDAEIADRCARWSRRRCVKGPGSSMWPLPIPMLNGRS